RLSAHRYHRRGTTRNRRTMTYRVCSSPGLCAPGRRRALLDINVLLALLDSDHVDHQLARDWINAEIQYGWASCAITQNGFVRIISQPRYPSPVPPSHGEERQPHGAAIGPARPGPGSPPGGAV